MPPKSLIQTRSSHILIQSEQIRRRQQPPEAGHQQRRDPRKDGPAVQPRRLLGRVRPARAGADQVPGLVPGLEHDERRLEAESCREDGRDGHFERGQQPQGAQQGRVQQERYEEEGIQEGGWARGLGVFSVREGTGHEAGGKGDTCSSDGNTIKLDAVRETGGGPEHGEGELQHGQDANGGLRGLMALARSPVYGTTYEFECSETLAVDVNWSFAEMKEAERRGEDEEGGRDDNQNRLLKR